MGWSSAEAAGRGAAEKEHRQTEEGGQGRPGEEEEEEEDHLQTEEEEQGRPGEEEEEKEEGEGEREEATTDAMEEASPSRCCRTRRLSG